ncbi:hypothetical protein EZV61_06930 [Corallincola luteus]|uniref:Ankyrin repeat domain-containing protein n=1 Tax=Corallincola luteus TaxID=1775177 RepID=A0ABY2AQ37_9GAMM|nr:ankyrin repeat domain-containing protein [Corallincola luteus]TCI03923.1 hypothetical protein EZV61_06930 [Corallincola luteus]
MDGNPRLSISICSAVLFISLLTGFTSPEQISQYQAALQQGNYNQLFSLDDEGIDHLDVVFSNGDRPLHFAIRQQNDELINYLLVRGTALNSLNEDGLSPLMLAARLGQVVTVEQLLSAKAEIDQVDSAGANALLLAVVGPEVDVERQIKIAQRLIAAGIDVNAGTTNGVTPLLVAIANGRSLLVDALVDANADVNLSESAGVTPIVQATQSGNLDVVAAVLKGKPNLRPLGPGGLTLLHYLAGDSDTATEEYRLEVIDLLIKSGISVDILDKHNRTPLFFAVVAKRPATVAALLNAGADSSLVNESGETMLMAAVQSGSLAIVEQLLAQSPDLTQRSNDGGSLLHFAMSEHTQADDAEMLPIVRLLIRKGAPIDVALANGATPFFLAARFNRLLAATALIDAGAQVNAISSDGNTALHVAVFGGGKEIVEYLLAHNADATLVNNDGLTALHMTTPNGTLGSEDAQAEIARVLVEAGVPVDIRSAMGTTALGFAADNGKQGLVRTLLQLGADINSQNDRGWTPLMRAVDSVHVEMVKLLLQYAPDLFKKNRESWTALHLTGNGIGNEQDLLQAEIAALLIDAGAPLEARHQSGWTPLMTVLDQNRVATAKVMLQKGAKVEAKTNSRTTSLIVAVEAGAIEAVELLLANGAKLDMSDRNGLTALLYTANQNARVKESTRALIAEKLMLAGANVNVFSINRNTALMRAVAFKQYQVAKALITHSPILNFEIKNRNNMSALMIAIGEGDPAMVRLLLSGGANANDKNSKRWSLLHLAAKADSKIRKSTQKEMIASLIKAGAQIDAKSDTGATPLQFAVASRNIPATVALIGAGAKVDLPDSNGVTALMRAVSSGQTDIVKLLIKHGANVNLTNLGGWSALHIAADKSDVDESVQSQIARLLIKAGAKTSGRTTNGATPLMLAVKANKPLLTQVLRSTSAEPNAANIRGITPLMQACHDGNLALVQQLLASKPNLAHRASNGLDVLQMTVANGQGGDRVQAGVVKLLIDAGAELGSKDGKGNTALHIAVIRKRGKVAEVMLAAGADQSILNKKGRSPLMLAVFEGNLKFVSQLLRYKPDLSLTSKVGSTALHFTSMAKNKGGDKVQAEIAKLLLDAGASVDALTVSDYSPLMFAAMNGYYDVMTVLVAGGADLSLVNSGYKNMTAADLASEAGHHAIARYLQL